MAKTMHEHYLRIQCADKPGVLAAISSILAKAGISIATVTQHGVHGREPVALVMRTHRTSEAQMLAALKRIGRLPELRAKPVVIRVEEKLGEEPAPSKE
jgi:homoserine dehydrogenase